MTPHSSSRVTIAAEARHYNDGKRRLASARTTFACSCSSLKTALSLDHSTMLWGASIKVPPTAASTRIKLAVLFEHPRCLSSVVQWKENMVSPAACVPWCSMCQECSKWKCLWWVVDVHGQMAFEPGPSGSNTGSQNLRLTGLTVVTSQVYHGVSTWIKCWSPWYLWGTAPGRSPRIKDAYVEKR